MITTIYIGLFAWFVWAFQGAHPPFDRTRIEWLLRIRIKWLLAGLVVALLAAGVTGRRAPEPAHGYCSVIRGIQDLHYSLFSELLPVADAVSMSDCSDGGAATWISERSSNRFCDAHRNSAIREGCVRIEGAPR